MKLLFGLLLCVVTTSCALVTLPVRTAGAVATAPFDDDDDDDDEYEDEDAYEQDDDEDAWRAQPRYRYPAWSDRTGAYYGGPVYEIEDD